MTRISLLSFRPAKPLDRATGLIGFARIQAGELLVDGVAVRRALDGRHVISLPSRRSRDGQEHSIVAPVSNAVGRDLERQVLDALVARGELP